MEELADKIKSPEDLDKVVQKIGTIGKTIPLLLQYLELIGKSDVVDEYMKRYEEEESA